MLKFEFCDELDSPTIGMIIDSAWYRTNHKELTDWCDQYNVHLSVAGMFFVPDMATRTLFTLRWA